MIRLTLRAAFVLASCILPGCQEGGARHPSAPITVEEQEVDLGLVLGGDRIRQEFPFTVSGNRPVVIRELRSSCQCMAVASAAVGESLRPGDRGVITLELNVDEYGGDFEGSVNVVTTPESAVPIVLRVKGTASSLPHVAGTQPLVKNVALGEEFVIQFNLLAQRPSGAPAYVPDLERSSLSGFRVESYEAGQMPWTPGGAQVTTGVLERHAFQLKHGPILAPTNQQERLEIAWKETDHRTRVLVELVAKHPLSLLTPDPFLGFLRPGEEVDLVFPFARKLERPLDTVSVKAVLVDDASASLSDDGRGIRVKLVAPESRGRFSRTWQVVSSDKGVDPMEFRVMGIVRE